MKIFIYPSFNDKVGVNTYILQFHDAFKCSDKWTYTNRQHKLRVLGVFFNLDADCFVFNWPENLLTRRFGKIQTLLLVTAICLLRICKKHIIWVLHNKQPHLGHTAASVRVMRFMAKCSTLVVTHSKEGIAYFDETYPDYKGKCIYIPHPAYQNSIILLSDVIDWDYIIWGGIEKRKNILEFLQFAKNSTYWQSQRVLICGKYNDEQYYRAVLKECSANITIIAQRLSDEELHNFISRSRIILFTYGMDSTLSSGALIYSLNFCKPIIGPAVGSFIDLQPMVTCYQKYEDIESLTLNSQEEQFVDYIQTNTWEGFPNKLLMSIKKERQQ